MIKIKNLTILLILTLFATSSIAAESNDDKAKPVAKLRDPAEFQKVIDEYKSYVAQIPKEIREEVVSFRKKVASLNKQKRQLYRELSQDSQNYLKKEQKFKKKLPLKHKSLINIETPGEKKKRKEKALNK